ncbi:Biopolymer transport protein ExbD/TolR [Lignipirellula cremea]|uniref:Biopolymer transport protein ExbD/TolR n=2 Tax=Lignipirellula cremea TaxID=2528010 RepID=A0A518DM91_9BACT|nr:Biopolymer transport protein ExbD/TolR [Lignipirellula cremea]
MAMGDIAFNLLIFFVILAKANDDSHVQWQPANVQKVERSQSTQASVVVDNEGKVFLNGQQTGIGQLAAGVGNILGTAQAGERTVLLKVDKNAKALIFEEVIEALSESGGEIFHVVEQKSP